MPDTSALQLRREAEKARKLADNAVTERDRIKFIDIAGSLEREAAAITAKLGTAAVGPSVRRSGVVPRHPVARRNASAHQFHE